MKGWYGVGLMIVDIIFIYRSPTEGRGADDGIVIVNSDL